MIRQLVNLLILLLLSSCEKEDNNLQKSIYKDVINETFLKVTHDFKNLSDINEVIVNPLDDHVDSIMVQRVKNDSTLPHNPYMNDLFSKLEKILNEPLDVDLENISAGQKFKLIGNKKGIKEYNHERSAFAGSSFISKVALDDNNNFGVFYIDVQFRKSIGSGGYFVFVEKKADKWTIDHIMQMWK